MCGGEVESINERDYCVYKRSEITETGFQCPQGYPHRHNLSSTVTCSRSPEEMPDEHKERIKRKYSTSPDTGLPDGGGVGSDADTGNPPISDTDMSTDTPDALSRPNACQDPSYREYRHRGDPLADGFSIPWKVVSHDAKDLPESFDATWKGVQTLGSPVTFDCPPTASDLNLNCTTNKALVFERADGTATRVEVAVALPIQSIDFPDKGSTVEVTMRRTFGSFSNRHPWGFSIERKSDDRYVVVIRGEMWQASAMGLQATHGPVGVAIDAKGEDPGSAFCITQSHCPKIHRLEPLTVTAMVEQSVNPGTSVTFKDAAGTTHRFWHLISMRRAPRMPGWPRSICTDIQHPFTMFAYGMVK